MMVSLVKGLAASLYAVVHSVPYQYQLDNFQQVKTYLLALVLVVDERGSFSAIDAHIFPCLVQTVFEDVD